MLYRILLLKGSFEHKPALFVGAPDFPYLSPDEELLEGAPPKRIPRKALFYDTTQDLVLVAYSLQWSSNFGQFDRFF